MQSTDQIHSNTQNVITHEINKKRYISKKKNILSPKNMHFNIPMLKTTFILQLMISKRN